VAFDTFRKHPRCHDHPMVSAGYHFKIPFGILPELWHAICCSNGYQIRGAAMVIKTLSELEKEHIRKVLKVTDWNIEKAALLLQITVPQLKRKIRVHGFQKEAPR